MASNENKRQKQLANKKRKEKARKKARAAAPSADVQRVEKMLENARSYPVFDCLVNEGWQTKGIATVLLARTQPNGLLLVGSYLVDIWCLGLKSTFITPDMTTQDYKRKLVAKAGGGDPMEKCPLELAHRIIYGGIDYAAQFGFKPDSDFEFSQWVLEERGALAHCEVTFGQNDKPLFVAGPRDNTQAILRQLAKTVGLGEGKAHYIVPIGPQPGDEDDEDFEVGDEDLDEDEDDDEDDLPELQVQFDSDIRPDLDEDDEDDERK